MITNETLRETFVSPAMKYYFDRKLAPLPSEQVDARIEELLSRPETLCALRPREMMVRAQSMMCRGAGTVSLRAVASIRGPSACAERIPSRREAGTRARSG